MLRASVEFPKGFVKHFERFSQQGIERAALAATDKASKRAKQEVRSAMEGAGLGRLGGAIGQFSDLEKGHVFRRGGGNFSASGGLAIRSKSKRTVGAVEAYTEGAVIRPKKPGWLWIPSKDIQRIVGTGKDRRRLTPALWNERGLDKRMGPLVRIKSINGYPLLVVETSAVALSGRNRSLRGRLKSGAAPKGYANKNFVVAFIGIPSTTRARRVDVAEIMRKHAASVGPILSDLIRI